MRAPRTRVTRRSFLRAAAAMALALSAPARLFAAGSRPAPGASGIAIDGLGFPGGRSGVEDAPLTPAEVDDLRASGLAATHLTVGAVGGMAPLAAFEKAVRDIARWEAEIDRHPDALARIRTAPDIEAAARAGRVGLVYGLQDGVSVEDDLDRLPALHQLGVRVIQPTYNRRNLLGDGVMEPADAGIRGAVSREHAPSQGTRHRGALRDRGGLPVRRRPEYAASFRDPRGYAPRARPCGEFRGQSARWKSTARLRGYLALT